jgi:hypothetical protein
MFDKEEFIGAAVAMTFIGVGLLMLALLLAGIAAFVAGLVFYFCWNYGIVHLVSDCGGVVMGVDYWTAFFSAWFLTFVGMCVFGGSAAKVSGS